MCLYYIIIAATCFGPSGPDGTGAENLDPPGYDPRMFQPVASRYTDYAIPAPYINMLLLLLLLLLLVFSPWACLGRDQSSVRRPVRLWYAASWASS